jgi:hypothetical protein
VTLSFEKESALRDKEEKKSRSSEVYQMGYEQGSE